MSVWSVAWRVVDTLLGIAMKADELAERRRSRRRFNELVEARAKDIATERTRVPTVVLPRPPAVPTTRPVVAPAAPPTAPTRPVRGR